KIAVMIDADNTQLGKLEAVLREISAYGRIVVKRAYGNWKKQALKNWEDELRRLAIKPEQQFDYVAGKNATDIALVIGALDLLYTGIYDAFVLVSSDSDYTPLAIRLNESGVYVIGVGEHKTPESFRNSCDNFIFLENILSAAAPSPDESQQCEAGNQPSVPADALEEIHRLLSLAFEKYANDEGFANVASAGSFLTRAKPDFDCRTYGYSKLSDLIAAYPDRYELERQPGRGTVPIAVYRCLS
ncbi:MAG: NYN domain-containing protein, partial [Clostridiales bacterium]|nr:NYN domain-containing protein [Clostridiales bacterium]